MIASANCSNNTLNYPYTFALGSPQAKFLVWASNAAAERYITELIETGGDRGLTLEEVREISQKHHIRFV